MRSHTAKLFAVLNPSVCRKHTTSFERLGTGKKRNYRHTILIQNRQTIKKYMHDALRPGGARPPHGPKKPRLFPFRAGKEQNIHGLKTSPKLNHSKTGSASTVMAAAPRCFPRNATTLSGHATSILTGAATRFPRNASRRAASARRCRAPTQPAPRKLPKPSAGRR